MACRISELVIDAADPGRLAAFWSEVLGYVEIGREDDGSIEIGPPDAGFGGPQPTLVLSPSSEPRAGKLGLHIDVNATDRDQDAELERLLALGARPADVGQTGTENWHVLADPEGNEFCLLHTRLKPLGPRASWRRAVRRRTVVGRVLAARAVFLPHVPRVAERAQACG